MGDDDDDFEYEDDEAEDGVNNDEDDDDDDERDGMGTPCVNVTRICTAANKPRAICEQVIITFFLL